MKSIEKYESVIKADAATINKYRGMIPEELLAVWQEYGFGYMLNGYLRVINPDDYIDIIIAEIILEYMKFSECSKQIDLKSHSH